MKNIMLGIAVVAGLAVAATATAATFGKQYLRALPWAVVGEEVFIYKASDTNGVTCYVLDGKTRALSCVK